MKVLLVANYIPDSQQSMQRIAGLFSEGLRRVGVETHIIRPEQVFLRRGKSTAGPGKFLGYLDKYLIFPKKLKKAAKGYDVVHILDHSNAVYAPVLGEVPTLVTCCDMLAVRSSLGEFRENPTRWSGRFLQKHILKGLKRVDRFLCISNATRNDVLRLTERERESAVTVYLGKNYDYQPLGKDEASEILRENGVNIPGPLFLNVGKNNWYKNRSGLIDIFKEIVLSGNTSHCLVMAGEPLAPRLKERIVALGLGDRVLEVPGPSNELMRALYSGAEALIYPSIAEGFGWPIVEAQACGCPVFTTDREPMTEAGGDAAVYFDPADPEGCASIIAETLSDPDKVDTIRKKGIENAKRFDTNKMIDKYVEIYEGLAQETKRK